MRRARSDATKQSVVAVTAKSPEEYKGRVGRWGESLRVGLNAKAVGYVLYYRMFAASSAW